MHTPHNTLSIPNIREFARELTAAPGTDLHLREGADHSMHLMLGNLVLGDDLNYYQEISRINPEYATARFHERVLLPINAVDAKLYEKTIEMLNEKTNLTRKSTSRTPILRHPFFPADHGANPLLLTV